MNKLSSQTLSLLLCAGLAIPALAAEKVTPIALNKLPQAVRDTITQHAGSGKIKKVERVEENGKVEYEAKIKDGKRVFEVETDEAGKFLDEEEKASFGSLPAEVKATIEKQAGKAKVKELEMQKDAQGNVKYVFELKGQKGEFGVSADGKYLGKQE